MGFDYFYCSSVDEYIIKFKELYSEDIILPCGIPVYCGIKKEEIMHILCGKDKSEIDKGRAPRMSWIKEIIEDKTTKAKFSRKKIIFINKYKKAHCVIICTFNFGMKKFRITTFYICHKERYLNFETLPNCDLNLYK